LNGSGIAGRKIVAASAGSIKTTVKANGFNIKKLPALNKV